MPEAPVRLAGSAPGSREERASEPLRRASRAWTALRISPVLEGLAFLARGLERGRPPQGAACPQHVLGPLVGTIVGPVGGLLPRDAVEELFQRAAVVRGVSLGEWFQWRRSRFSAHLVEDVTALAHRGSCPGRSDAVRCTCGPGAAGSGGAGSGAEPAVPVHLRAHPALGAVPALIPDASGRTDPWQDALVELASTFRGRGSPLASRFSGSGPPTVLETRTLALHLDRLSAAFAGPRRADRMGGLARVEWSPPLCRTAAWQAREDLAGTDRGREALLGQLLGVIGL